MFSKLSKQMLLLKGVSDIKSERKGSVTLYYLVDVVPIQYCCRAITTTKVWPCCHMIALELGKKCKCMVHTESENVKSQTPYEDEAVGNKQ